MGARKIACLFAASALCVAASGCGGERVFLNDTGEACLTTDGTWPDHMEGQTFEAGAELMVMVRFHSCLSSTCDTDREAECSVDVEGDQIFVTAHAEYTDLRGPGVSCTTDCVILEATCSVSALPEGSYEIWFGRETHQLEIPSTTGAYCVDVRD